MLLLVVGEKVGVRSVFSGFGIFPIFVPRVIDEVRSEAGDKI